MERVLKAVPVDLRVKMEALVHDLTLALEESSNSTNIKRRWGLRRRARSTGNIPSLSANKQSDDSSSSICDIRIPKTSSATKYQSDSDDTNRTKRFARFSNLNNASNIESDSVNENFVPRINTKRKRKFKRMAVDSDSNPSTSQAMTQKKRLFRNNCENRYSTIWCGKRKRSCRERSIDCDMRSSKPSRNSKNKSHREKIRSEDAMDCSRISSSSISSSDSEAGVKTNDEDHEGDDEQSDWIGESTWWDDESTTEEKVLSTNPAFQAIINYRQRFQWNREGGLNGREIRAGRRHVDNKPGYSIITSANEKVSRFLQDPSQSELKLHAMRQPEREKLRRLANLYSLSLKGDLSCPILYKTRHTTQAICVDQVSFNRFSDYKRLRKTPPQSPNSEMVLPNPEVPIFRNNFAVPMVNHVQSGTESVNFDWTTHRMESDVQASSKINSIFGHSKSS